MQYFVAAAQVDGASLLLLLSAGDVDVGVCVKPCGYKFKKKTFFWLLEKH